MHLRSPVAAALIWASALELRLPPGVAPTKWRGVFGENALSFGAGSFVVGPGAGWTVTLELLVNDTSDLRAAEVVDVVLPAVARRTAGGLSIQTVIPAMDVPRPSLAVLVETESTALASSDPAMYDTRVVYSAFVDSHLPNTNRTWQLVARVRTLHVGAACEAPEEMPSEQPNVSSGLTSIGARPGYFAPKDGWDTNCSAIPPAEEAAWHAQLSAAGNYSAEHPELACLPAGHWHWNATGADWAYAKLVVMRTAPMTFYMPLGFSGGYVGVQNHNATEDGVPGSRYLVFSVWDQGSQAEVVDLGDAVEARRFHGELRGFQITRELAWEVEKPIQLLLHAETDSPEPRYTSYVYNETYGRWDLIASVRVRPCGLTPYHGLGHLNSFIEVFSLLDCKSHREASYNLWTKSGGEPWTPAQDAMLWGTHVKDKLRGRVVDGELVLDVGADLRDTQDDKGTVFRADPPRPVVLDGPLPAGRGGPVDPPADGLVWTDRAGARSAVLDNDFRAC